MKLFKTVSLLLAILQTPAITFARYCDDRDRQPPPECRYYGNRLNTLLEILAASELQGRP
jgi:hypothetical protein